MLKSYTAFLTIAILSGCTGDSRLSSHQAAAAEPAGGGAWSSANLLLKLRSGAQVRVLDETRGGFVKQWRLQSDVCVRRAIEITDHSSDVLVSIPTRALNGADASSHERVWGLSSLEALSDDYEGCNEKIVLPNSAHLNACPLYRVGRGGRLVAFAQAGRGRMELVRKIGAFALSLRNGQYGLVSSACNQPRWPGAEDYTLTQYIELTRERFDRLDALVQRLWRDVTMRTASDLRADEGVVEAFIDAEAPHLEECETCFLGPFVTDLDVVRAFLLNVLSTKNHYRKSGKAYAIHPAALSHYVLEFAEDALSRDDLKQVIILGNTHDVIEELLRQYHVQGRTSGNPWLELLHQAGPSAVAAVDAATATIAHVRLLKDELNRMFPVDWRVGDRVVQLMEPVLAYDEVAAELGTSEFFAEHVLFAHMIRRRQDLHMVTVKVADRIDFFMDYDFVFAKNRGVLRSREQLAENLARGFWLLEYIAEAKVIDVRNGLPHRAIGEFPGFPQPLLDLVYAVMEWALYRDPRLDTLLAAHEGVPAMTKDAFIVEIARAIAELERVARNQSTLDALVDNYLQAVGIEGR